MKGKILNYNPTNNSGVISGDDGNRYSFEVVEWKGNSEPRSGGIVDFEAADSFAKNIYADIATGSSKKIPAALFAFFLGGLGIHKFYLGYKKQGIIMLLVFLFGLILIGIPSGIIGLIAFIEAIIYITKSDEEFEQIYVVGKKGWF